MLQVATIKSVFKGMAPTQYASGEDQYNSAIGIDPDFSIGSQTKTSGAIVPTRYEKFSGANIDSYPLWMMTNPKDTNIYIYQSGGKFVSYSSTLASETLIGTPTSGAGNGAAYYNNYVYLTTPTNVSAYGPLNNSPTLANAVWGTTWSKTLLTNTTYPSLAGVPIPNHAMHVHTDNKLYFCDFKDGKGMIHYIKTKKTTAEGDTDDNSAYQALDLPFGYYPTDIESWGTDLVILAMQTVSSSVNQGTSALFFWDTVASSFYRQIPVPDPIATALHNHNGSLLIFSGNASAGVRVSTYLGGDKIKLLAFNVAYMEEGTPPLAGAVDSLGNRVNWGASTVYPATSASVYAFGSKDARLPEGLHNVIKTTSAGATPTVTSIKYVQQANNSQPRMIVGWGDVSQKGLDKFSTSATYSSTWRSKVFNVGRKFKIQDIRLNLGAAVAANMSVTPKIYTDDDWTTAASTLTAINNTNYTASEKNVNFKRLEINANHSFLLELNFAGTVELPVLLPITIVIDVLKDE